MNRITRIFEEWREKSADRVRLERNRAGRMKGYAECGSCHDTYDWKPYHIIEVDGGRGAFPYCQECNETLPVNCKKYEVDKLITRWMQHNFWGEDWDKTRLSLHTAIEEGK